MTKAQRSLERVSARAAFACGALITSASSVALASQTVECAGDWATTVYSQARSSVVRVTVGNGESGTGFFFIDTCHVATALHVVASGRPIRIRFSEGGVVPADVIATDSDHDLAILQLRTCGKRATALKPGATPSIGAPVMAIGNPLAGLYEPTGAHDLQGPFSGLLAWSATVGVVSGVGNGYIQTDAALVPGVSGGPLIDCHGDVVGIADLIAAPGVAFAVTTGWLDALGERALASPTSFGGRGRYTPSLGLQFDIRSSDSFQGLSLGGAFVIHDVWWLGFRASYLPWGGPNASGSGTLINPALASGAWRVGVAGAFGPRFLLFPFSSLVTYVQIAAGGAVTFDGWTLTQFSVTPGAASLTSTSSDYRATRWEPLGMVGFFFGSKGNFEVSYACRVDADRLASSTSQVSIGFWL